MSTVKKYRVKKDVPFQFLQIEGLKEGMIGTGDSHLYVYYFTTEVGRVFALRSDIVERWTEYFEPVIEDDEKR